MQQQCLRRLHEYGKDNTGPAKRWYGNTAHCHADFPVRISRMSSSFAFDNASNHCYIAEDALIASNVSLNPGRGQPRMREGFDHARGLPHPLVFSDNHPNLSLHGKTKGTEAILRERGLWPNNGWRSDGFGFRLGCPKKRQKDWLAGTGASGCNPEMGAPLAAALAKCSPSNKTSGNKRVNCKWR